MNNPYPIVRRLLTPFINWRVKEIKGWEKVPRGNYILAINHIGYLDPFFIAVIWAIKKRVKVYFIAKQEICQSYKKLGLMDWLGLIPMDPLDKARCLDLAGQYLASGKIVGIFPEGKRNTEKELLKGKTGTARLALMTGRPVVPVGFIGPSAWTVGESLKNLFRPSKKIIVNIGHPLDFFQDRNNPVTKELLEDVTRQIMLAIGHLCEKKYSY